MTQKTRRRQNTAVTAAGSVPHQWTGREHDADIMLPRKHQPRLAQSCPAVRADRPDCPCDVGKPWTVPVFCPIRRVTEHTSRRTHQKPGAAHHDWSYRRPRPAPSVVGAFSCTPPCAHPSDSHRRMRVIHALTARTVRVLPPGMRHNTAARQVRSNNEKNPAPTPFYSGNACTPAW